MKTLSSIIVAGLVTLTAFAAHADETLKLVVCQDYKLFADKNAEDRPTAVCFDKEKPFIIRYFSEVTVVTSAGAKKVVVGSR